MIKKQKNLDKADTSVRVEIRGNGVRKVTSYLPVLVVCIVGPCLSTIQVSLFQCTFLVLLLHVVP